MKKFLLLGILFCLGAALKAQRVYFIYLQSEAGSPFYVKMGDKVYSSTSEGYLILSKLKDSTYSFSLGQPNTSQEPQFRIAINKTDKGLLVKNFDDGLGLFDLQTMAVYKSINSSAGSSSSQTSVARTDGFTTLLARAADDSTLLYQTVMVEPVKEQPKEVKEAVVIAKEETAVPKEAAITEQKENKPLEAAAPVPSTETPAIVKKEEEKVKEQVKKEEEMPPPQVAVATPKTEQPAAPQAEEEYKKSVVRKRSESSTTGGFGLVFLDNNNGEIDTIRIVIPNPRMILPEAQPRQSTENKKFLEINADPDSASAVKPVVVVKPKEKPACSDIANDNDFLKLRKVMAGKKTDDAMIGEAKKQFKTKCFTTEQIRNLSVLFLSPSGKYHFFDAAYAHVSDKEQFSSLQSEIKDDYFSNRFKALIGM